MSIPKLCVGQLFCVGAALCGRPPPGNHIGLPLRLLQRFLAMSSRRYEFFCFLLTMHRFNVDTVVACACRSTGKAYQGFCVRTSAFPPASFRAHGARYCRQARLRKCTNLLWFALHIRAQFSFNKIPCALVPDIGADRPHLAPVDRDHQVGRLGVRGFVAEQRPGLVLRGKIRVVVGV